MRYVRRVWKVESRLPRADTHGPPALPVQFGQSNARAVGRHVGQRSHTPRVDITRCTPSQVGQVGIVFVFMLK